MTPHQNLAAVALADLQSYFAAQGHNPSARHWDALGAVLGTLDGMANGACPSDIFLAALDPGIGKSSAVLAFARALLSSPGHREVGMIVCVGRIAEAQAMAEALRGRCPDASLAVMTSDDAANALSTAEPSVAQVLITTQQRIERATETQGFEACGSFYYHGAPRQVRAWDEAWLPGVAITVSGDDLLGLVKLLRSASPDCANAVRALGTRLDALDDGAAVDVPDFEAEHRVSFHAILAQPLRDDQRSTLSALTALCGKVARVRHNGPWGAAMLTYKDTLPHDLAPLLVLDASGRVRETYKHIEKHRGGLTRLPEAVKDYGPLTVHVWGRGGGKGAWGTSGDELVEGIAETIRERPNERWLVVAHKSTGGVRDVGRAIKRKLPERIAGNVEAITWGNHMASNLYADVPNVILAGTLFMPNSHYTALTHLAQDLSVVPGLASKDDVERTTQGEHANLILQALCRGRVRRSDGDRCLPMNAYVIAAKRSGIADALPGIFPGCKVRPWKDSKANGSDHVSRALAFVERTVAAGASDLPNGDIMRAVKVDRRNFNQRVTKHQRWADGLRRMGLETYAAQGRRTGGVRRVCVIGDVKELHMSNDTTGP